MSEKSVSREIMSRNLECACMFNIRSTQTKLFLTHKSDETLFGINL